MFDGFCYSEQLRKVANESISPSVHEDVTFPEYLK